MEHAGTVLLGLGLLFLLELAADFVGNATALPRVTLLMLGGIATATDPAATADVVRRYRASGPFVETLAGIVAIDEIEDIEWPRGHRVASRTSSGRSSC